MPNTYGRMNTWLTFFNVPVVWMSDYISIYIPIVSDASFPLATSHKGIATTKSLHLFLFIYYIERVKFRGWCRVGIIPSLFLPLLLLPLSLPLSLPTPPSPLPD